MSDIATRSDIELVVSEFYTSLLKDDLLAFIFTDVAKINLEEHLPIICDFWESILLGSQNYNRNTMLKHLELHAKEPLLMEHFDRWLYLWETTVSKHYNGNLAELAIARAKMIAGLMKHKVSQL